MEGNRKSVSIHCAKTGIHVDGANNIGSTSDDIVSSRRQFLRVAVHWWNTYCGRDEEDEPPRNCDVGTAEEQEVRFDGFCMAHKEIKEPGLKVCSDNCPFVKTGSCDLHWAQMPYTEGGAK